MPSSLESLNDKVGELNKSLEELLDKVDADEKKLGEIKEKQKQNAALQEINNQQDNVKAERNAKEESLTETKLDITRCMESLWKTVISPVVSSLMDDARRRIKELDTKNTIAGVGQNISEHIDDIFSAPLSCPDCGHNITRNLSKILYWKTSKSYLPHHLRMKRSQNRVLLMQSCQGSQTSRKVTQKDASRTY